jgi:hypothetical protein
MKDHAKVRQRTGSTFGAGARRHGAASRGCDFDGDKPPSALEKYRKLG